METQNYPTLQFTCFFLCRHCPSLGRILCLHSYLHLEYPQTEYFVGQDSVLYLEEGWMGTEKKTEKVTGSEWKEKTTRTDL